MIGWKNYTGDIFSSDMFFYHGGSVDIMFTCPNCNIEVLEEGIIIDEQYITGTWNKESSTSSYSRWINCSGCDQRYHVTTKSSAVGLDILFALPPKTQWKLRLYKHPENHYDD